MVGACRGAVLQLWHLQHDGPQLLLLLWLRLALLRAGLV
jgi:hypothetical protein